MVSAFVVTLGSVYFFGTEREELMGDASDLSMDFLWSVTLGLAGLWIITFASLLAMMEPKYRTTFISTQTGWQFMQTRFRSATTDAERGVIFYNNVKLWKSDIGEEVQAWVHENWEDWMNEKPEWLTDALKSKIPIEYIPIEEEKVEEKHQDQKDLDLKVEIMLEEIEMKHHLNK